MISEYPTDFREDDDAMVKSTTGIHASQTRRKALIPPFIENQYSLRQMQGLQFTTKLDHRESYSATHIMSTKSVTLDFRLLVADSEVQRIHRSKFQLT